MPPIIAIHIHNTPMEGFKPEAQELIRRGREDFDDAVRFAARTREFLKFMDSEGIERGLINYVSPDVIGFTSEMNEWVARYCQTDPKRLLAFGSVHPKYVLNPGTEVDRLKKIGIRALTVHPSHQLFAPNDRGNIEKFRAPPISRASQQKTLYDNAAPLFPAQA